ncbi:MAG: hypothetical protein Kow00124_16510 [Anaerolineae bacterium]
MAFVRGNRAIRDHLQDGRDIYLFKCVEAGPVEFVGQMVYVGSHERQGPDVTGEMRCIIVFELKPVQP